MANYTVTVIGTDIGLGSGNSFFISGGGSSSSPLQLDQGDTLTVSHSSGSDATSITVSDFASTIWTNSSSISVARGSTAVKTSKSNATHSVTDTITVSASTYNNGSIFVRINDPTPPADTTPDNFSSDLSTISGANTSQEYYLGSFTV